jgi:ABC-type sugar transport system ATPase subunit
MTSVPNESPGVASSGLADLPQSRARVPAIAASRLVKSYGAVEALREVSFEVRAGEIHGLCGHNGAGKSTLVRVLVGLEQPDAGVVHVAGEALTLHGAQDAQRHGIALVDQELSLVADLTVAENIFLGNVDAPVLRWRSREEARARELLGQVGLTQVGPAQLLSELQVGERQLVEIARLLGRKAEVLILDEPTATLTDSEIARVFAAIRAVAAQGASVIFVSHRLDEILSLCSRVTVLRDGRNIGTRAVAELTKDHLVEMMLGEQRRKDASIPISSRRRTGGVRIRDLTVRDRVHGFALDAPTGAIVGLAGQLGSGASHILRAVAGLEPDLSGEIVIHDRRVRLASPRAAARAGIHYVSNDRKSEGLFLSQPTDYNLLATRIETLSRFGILQPRRMRRGAYALAHLVGVDTRRLSASVGTLSGGNQQKVLMGRCLEQPKLNLLLLDDPTRGVDVGGRAEIHRLIVHAAASGATVLFASSELDEIVELSDLVVTLFAGRMVSRYDRESVSASHVLSDMTHRRDAARSL